MIVRVAVLSDMHFAPDEKGAKYSHMILNRPQTPKQHPFRDLVDLIKEHGLSADIVMTPGDMTLQADQASLKAAWASLKELSSHLGASEIFAATGNHDIASRKSTRSAVYSNPEIWESLKQLEPQYPHPNASIEQWWHYWALHFTTAAVGDVRVVVLNTCNTHVRGAEEYEKGRVTDFTLAKMRERIEAEGAKPLNLLLCHHHPTKQPDLSERDADYSEMEQGRKLLATLEDTGQNWIVIHGHNTVRELNMQLEVRRLQSSSLREVLVR